MSEATFALRTLIGSHAGSLRAQLRSEFSAAAIIADMEKITTLVETFFSVLVRIERDDTLSPLGKNEARRRAGREAATALDEWRAKHVGGLDGREAAELRILAAADRTTKPSEATVAALLDRLVGFSPSDVGRLYATGSDSEKQALEGVAALLPRLPARTKDGVRWMDTLPPPLIEEAVAKRSALADPAAANRLHDVKMLKSVHVVIVATAERLIADALAKYGLHDAPEAAFRDPMTGSPIPQPAAAK